MHDLFKVCLHRISLGSMCDMDFGSDLDILEDTYALIGLNRVQGGCLHPILVRDHDHPHRDVS